FGLHGAASSVFTMAMLNPGVFLPVVISTFFFVASLLFDWKLSRMTGYDLSKIAIAASSAPMIAALMSLGLKALFGIGGVPFSSALSWIAPVGVIAAAYYSSLNDEEPSSDGEFTLAGGEKVSVRALNKTHIREYAPEITEAMNWIAGINWDVRDLYEVWNDTQRQHSFLAFDAQEEIVGIVFAFERNFIDVDVPAEIGTGIFTISASRDNLLIHSLAVREGYRRQGLAQHLILSAVDNYTKSNPHVDPGQLFVTIHAKKGDAAANKLYGEKLGFNALGAHIYDSEETADGKINTGQKREFIAYIAPASQLLGSQLLGSQLLGSVSQGAASQEDVLFAEPGLQEAELLMRVFQGVENRTKSLAEPSELQAAI
ncbi:MAG: GNAT family N-acetyltransferase, partial [Candidatus Omnitrophota bacterium]